MDPDGLPENFFADAYVPNRRLVEDQLPVYGPHPGPSGLPNGANEARHLPLGAQQQENGVPGRNHSNSTTGRDATMDDFGFNFSDLKDMCRIHQTGKNSHIAELLREGGDIMNNIYCGMPIDENLSRLRSSLKQNLGQYYNSNNTNNNLLIYRMFCMLNLAMERLYTSSGGQLMIHTEPQEMPGNLRRTPSTFDSSECSDVVLLVENNEVHASRAILALHSPVFKSMFFGQFDEHEKDIIPLPGIVHNEFIDFLRVIYPERKKVTEESVEFLLKLGDLYDCATVLRKCVKFLGKTTNVAVSLKLLYADKYRLPELREICFKQMTSPSAFRELSASPHFSQYSPELLKAIISKIPT